MILVILLICIFPLGNTTTSSLTTLQLIIAPQQPIYTSFTLGTSQVQGKDIIYF